MLPRRRAYAGLVIVLAALMAVRAARAEVLVSGDAIDVTVEVQDATVEDVMVALQARFGLRYRSTAPLARRISGTHQGPLSRVVARVLDGYDFVLETNTADVEVTVYGAVKQQESNAATSVPRIAPAAAAKPPSAPSRREERRKRQAN